MSTSRHPPHRFRFVCSSTQNTVPDFIVNKLPRIPRATGSECHLRLATFHHPFDNRLLREFASGEERHAGLKHVVVALVHHLRGLAVGAKVVSAVFVPIVVAFCAVLAVLRSAVIRVAKANYELAGCVSQSMLVEG